MPIEFKYVLRGAFRSVFKKDKETGDIPHLTRISFDVVGVDDETLFALTGYTDPGAASVTINLG